METQVKASVESKFELLKVQLQQLCDEQGIPAIGLCRVADELWVEQTMQEIKPSNDHQGYNLELYFAPHASGRLEYIIKHFHNQQEYRGPCDADLEDAIYANLKRMKGLGEIAFTKTYRG